MRRLRSHSLITWASLAFIVVGLLGHLWPSHAQQIALPPAQVHPLPALLQQWQDPQQQGDYFDQVQATSVGHLIWSQFPVQVYIDPPLEPDGNSTWAIQQSQNWHQAVQQAVQEWGQYLPLQVAEQIETADIVVRRIRPALRFLPPGGSGSGQLPMPRARAAETRFEFYRQSLPIGTNSPNRQVLAHRMIIQIRPDQAALSTLATARHELGHALGIWGHSDSPNDALYVSQVGQPPLISGRDINTLKRVYEQPTRLGWPLPSEAVSPLPNK